MYSNNDTPQIQNQILYIRQWPQIILRSRLLALANIPFSATPYKIVTNVSAISLLTKLIKISLPYKHKTFSTFEGL